MTNLERYIFDIVLDEPGITVSNAMSHFPSIQPHLFINAVDGMEQRGLIVLDDSRVMERINAKMYVPTSDY